MSKSALVISLDFELHWGVRDHSSVDSYRKHLAGTREAIAEMLRLFAHYKVKATWATVGLLMCEGRNDVRDVMPTTRPRYVDSRLNPYAMLSSLGDNEEADPFHFAPSLVHDILATSGMELATHTFSHYYTCAQGADVTSFEADLAAAHVMMQRFGQPMDSLVFPRNQYSQPFLKVAKEAGIRCFRGNQPSPLFDFSRPFARSLAGRLLRKTETYLPTAQHHFAQEEVQVPLSSVGASRFLCPAQRPGLGETLRLRRILHGMRTACREEQIFHLWWHPHNFGANLHDNISFLDAILQHFSALRERYGMESQSMRDAAQNML